MSSQDVTYKQLFIIFLKAGFAFGGGLGVILELEKQLVNEYKLISRKDFMSMFAVGRIVPSGTISALAIGFGYKYKKIPGVLIALFGVMLPGFTLTILLAALYGVIKGTEFFNLMNISVMPAAVGLIVISALNMGKNVFHSVVLVSFAIAAFVAALFLNVNPSFILIGGGVIGIVLFSFLKEGHDIAN